MTLRLRWTLVLVAATTLLLGAVAAALELGLRDLIRDERQGWLDSRRSAVLTELELLAGEADQRLSGLVRSGELDRLLEGVAGRDPAVLRAVADWAASRRSESGVDELLVLDDDGLVLSSAIDAERAGESHPAFDFLTTVQPGQPLLWNSAGTSSQRWILGAVRTLRVGGSVYLALTGFEIGSDRLAALKEELGLRELRWVTGTDAGSSLRAPESWRRDGDPRMVLLPGETATERTLRTVRRRLLPLAAAALLVTFLLAPWLAAGLARPLSRLAEAVGEIGRGSRRPDLPRGGPREVQALSEALGQLSLDLERAEDRIRGAERRGAWREIARRIAHEIRNALSPLSLALDNVETAVVRDDVEARRALDSSLAIARDQLGSLERLVTEFHGFARSPRLHVAPFDPGSLLESALEGARAALPSARLRLESVPTLPLVSGDVEQLRRAIHNLLKNAAESAPGDEVVLAAGAGPGADEWWVAIRDQGPGLDPAVAARMGEPYLSTKPGGTGLGLPLVVQIAEAHGGRLDWRASEPRGLVMRIVLPTRPQPADPGEEEA